MDFKSFHARYLEEELDSLTEEVLDIFSQAITPEISKEYDVVDVMLDFLGYHENKANYEFIEDLYQVLMDYNQEVFLEIKEYFVEVLVKYHCFQKNGDKVEAYLQDFINFGYRNYDVLLITLHFALFYGYTQKVDELIVHLYEDVKQDKELIRGASIDFTLFKFSIELEKCYQQYETSGSGPEWEPLQKTMEAYDFDFIPKFRRAVERGMVHSGERVREKVLRAFPKDKQATLATLQLIFIRYMRQRGCAFVVGAMIWNALLEYWANNESQDWEAFFQFDEERFTRFLGKKGGIIMDYRALVAALLWGSTHAIAFLKSIQLFDEEHYQAQRQQITAVKQAFKEANNVDLWQYNFVFDWQAANDEADGGQAEEKQLFADSFQLTSKGQNDASFGDIENFLPKPSDIWGNGEIDLPPIAPEKPTRRTHNFKRNERVTVRYSDGTVKENVKFKTIQDDFELGACEVV